MNTLRTLLLLATFVGFMLGYTPLHAKTRTVGYAVHSARLSREDSAAIRWLRGSSGFVPKIIRIDQKLPAASSVDVFWIHIPDSTSYDEWTPFRERLRELGKVFRSGGKLFLTDYAALLPFEFGIESSPPEVQSLEIKDDWLFDQRGLQGFRGHPVFTGLFGGTFLWDPNTDQRLYRVGYFGSNFPSDGKVVGVDKAYVFLYADSKLMLEYAGGKGRLLTVGSCVYFAKENNRRKNLEKFIGNCLLYLMGDLTSGPVTYWLKAENKARPFVAASTPIGPFPQRALAELPHSELLLSRTHPQNEFFDVAGRRALVMGFENGGVDELWVHPFRIVRNFQAGIVSGDSVAWLQNLPVVVDVRPESFTRTYQTQYGALREEIFPSLNGPGAVIHYSLQSDMTVQLVVKYRCDLRWMWPYDERALGDVYYGYDEKLGALHVKDISGDFYCVIGGDVQPLKQLSGQYGDIRWESGEFAGTATDANQVFNASAYELNEKNGHVLNLALVGTDEGRSIALREYRNLLEHPRDVYEELVKHYAHLLTSSVTIQSPDTEFNALFKWALVGTDRFLTTTPRLGTALVAGFSTTARGWDGEHKISGRPGYAWYFGRDSEWSSFAIDDYGDFGLVKKQLEFLQKYQDRSGKIFHEISTSGVVHYDAADATPLYVILAAHYLRASGDIQFIGRSWPSMKKAMDFLYSTDTDGDLLIENTNVGHGWIEGGKLWPVHTEFYLAGLWAQALKDAQFITAHLGKKSLSDKYRRDGEKVVKILNSDFWNPNNNFFNFGKRKDGTYNHEPTVLPAPVMYFGVLDRQKVNFMLDQFGGDWFSTDWGVRIVTSASPLFNPTGYHYGSIWPLFTGWTALAEYQYGNSTQAFSHIINNLYIKNNWALGFVEEVMHGTIYKPTGVCPHQCWSETNILHPAITGMVGWKPDATSKFVRLTPKFPIHWDTVAVNNLRVGSSVVRFSMERGMNTTRYRFQLIEGSAVTVSFAPEVPAGMEIQGGRLSGIVLNRTFLPDHGVLAHPVEFSLHGDIEIVFKHTKGVGVVPLMPRPQPGDSSAEYRFVRAELQDHSYVIEFNGKPGGTATFDVRLFDQGVAAVQGAQLLRSGERGIVRLRVSFDVLRAPFVKKQVVLRVEEL